MAIGRISGPMLYSNLERQGVDLAIEGNLIYADVTQLRVGINTNTPDAELQVVGQSHLGNIVVTGNVISSTTGHVNLGTAANVVITGGASDYVLVTDGAGNLRWDEISNLDQTWGNLFFSGNQISITELDGNLELAANGSGYVVALNNLYAPNIITGNVDALYFNGDVRADSIITTGNIEAPFVITNVVGDLYGNVSGANVAVTGNVDAEYFNGNLRSTNIISAGNIIAPYFVGDLVGNIAGQLQGDVFGNISGNNATFTNNVAADWFNGNITGASSNFVTSNAAAFYGNVFAQAVISPVGDLHLGAATDDPNNIIRFDSVSAFDIPSGTTAQRPPTPDYGYVRYNTDIGSIEWWGGSSWVPGSNLIVSENITPDGVNAVYTLGQTTTENAILVNINGTIQQAGAGAYSVAGNQITFAEVPLVTDIIEIRYIAGGVAALSVDFANIAGNVIPSANITYDLGSPDFRWRDLWLSGNTINIGSATLSAVGNTIQLPAGSSIGGANVDVTAINANIAAANAAIITANTAMKSYVDQGLADALFVAGSYGNLIVAAYLPTDSTITTIQANVGAYQTYANANVAAIQASVGAYQTYANANIANIQANIGAYQTYANLNIATNVSSIQANIGAYQTYANANVAALQTSIGEFYNYANAKIGTNSDSNVVILSVTDSTSTSTGALVVRGGLGLAGNLNTSGNINTGNVALSGNLKLTGNGIPTITFFRSPDTDVTTGEVYGNVDFVGEDASTNAAGVRGRISTIASGNSGGAEMRLMVGGQTSIFSGSSGQPLTIKLQVNSGGIRSDRVYTDEIVGPSRIYFKESSGGGVDVAPNTIASYGRVWYTSTGNGFYEVNVSHTFSMSSTDTFANISLSNYNPSIGAELPGTSGTGTTSELEIWVTGIYIADTTVSPYVVSRLRKRFIATVSRNTSTGNWTVHDQQLCEAVYNSDATNFAAGAVNAGKVYLSPDNTAGFQSLNLKFDNRTSAGVNSLTTWAFTLKIHTLLGAYA